MPMSQTSSRLVTLGLVIEQPGSGYQVERRLNERLASTQFGPSAAKHALTRAQRDGLVRRVSGKYEATPTGVEHFERWLRSASVLPPIREELLARVALCRPKDMPRLVEVLREAELACLEVFDSLNRKSRGERIAAQGWRGHIDIAVIDSDAAWWDARIKWLTDLREGVQRAWRTYQAERRPGSPTGV
jgi:DNA-binding PadR family transcriptional regulator